LSPINSQVYEQVSDTEIMTWNLLTLAKLSNEGRMAYGRVATRHFQGGEY
jgi:hypothetical protein